MLNYSEKNGGEENESNECARTMACGTSQSSFVHGSEIEREEEDRDKERKRGIEQNKTRRETWLIDVAYGFQGRF